MVLADRMCVLHRGRTLQAGTPAEVTTRPVSPEVARLVDLRNLFDGAVAEHRAVDGKTVIDWMGMRIEAALQTAFAPGKAIAWVVPDGFVVLHRRDRPSRGDQENPVAGRIDSLAVVGQTAQITLRIADDDVHPLHFSVPAHVARRNGLVVGGKATVSLLAEGIHLMASVPGDGR
jgi:molybdate transport system ATP-binding protein